MKASVKLQAALGECRLLDQLAYRISKLQDSLGEKVLPGLIDLAEEPLPEDSPFAVKLQRLERLGVVEVEVWRKLRELHNQIAHEYTDQPAVKAAAINRFLEGVEVLIDALRQAESFAGQRMDAKPGNTKPSTEDNA